MDVAGQQSGGAGRQARGVSCDRVEAGVAGNTVLEVVGQGGTGVGRELHVPSRRVNVPICWRISVMVTSANSEAPNTPPCLIGHFGRDTRIIRLDSQGVQSFKPLLSQALWEPDPAEGTVINQTKRSSPIHVEDPIFPIFSDVDQGDRLICKRFHHPRTSVRLGVRYQCDALEQVA